MVILKNIIELLKKYGLEEGKVEWSSKEETDQLAIEIISHILCHNKAHVCCFSANSRISNELQQKIEKELNKLKCTFKTISEKIYDIKNSDFES